VRLNDVHVTLCTPIASTGRCIDYSLNARLQSGSFRSAPDREAEYRDERVCLSVCLSVHDHIFGTALQSSRNFFVHVIYGRGSVLFWQRSDTLYISGFMDDVIFSQAKVAKRSAHATLGLAIKCAQ